MASPILRIENVSKHTGLSSVNSDNIRCLLAVPLNVKKQTIGTLYLFNKLASNISPFAEFTSEELRLISSFTHQIAIAIENHRLYADIHDIFLDYIKSIAAALDARDAYTHGHSRRVAEFSIGIGKELGLSEGELEFLELSATIHDIGKIGIGESVLNKPGKLTDEEYTFIKQHSIRGAEIVKQVDALKLVATIILHHHERWDGSGYPNALSGYNIHIYGRITALADVFDALSCERVYKKAWPMEQIIDFVLSERGRHFDPDLVDMFMQNIERFTEIAAKYQD